MKYSNDSLRAHAYGRTRYSLSVETRVDALDKLEQAENAERAKGSTACRFEIGAKPCEGLVRDLLNARGVSTIVRDESGHRYVDFSARPNRNTAGECRVYGQPCDVKTGGTVNYYADADWTEEDICPNKAYIAFTLLEQASEAKDAVDGICDWTAILSRETFIDLCGQASRKGLRGTFHVTTRGTLSFQPTPLAKLRAMIQEGIEAGEIETLEGYLLDRAE